MPGGSRKFTRSSMVNDEPQSESQEELLSPSDETFNILTPVIPTASSTPIASASQSQGETHADNSSPVSNNSAEHSDPQPQSEPTSSIIATDPHAKARIRIVNKE